MTGQREASARTSIRRGGLGDQPVAQAISRDAFDVYLPLWNDVPRPGRADLRPYIERGEVWLLEEDSDPVALIVLEPRADHMWVYSLAVRPDRQGRGHATRLLDFAREQAQAAGLKRLKLDVNDHMQHAVAVYRRHGFVAAGSSPHRTRPGQLMLAMVKELAG
jgi:ribosomal protein S18 acetylase RimI-like enzyme